MCFKSSPANLCQAILLYYTQISEQASSELAEPNCKQKYLTHSIVCRMLNNFCLQFRSANSGQARSETLVDILHD